MGCAQQSLRSDGERAGIVFVNAQRFPRTAAGLVRMAEALDALTAEKQLPPKGGAIWLPKPSETDDGGNPA